MGFRVPEPELRPPRTIKWFNGFPLLNCVTDRHIFFADQTHAPQYIFPPSGQITSVPKRILRWRTVDEGVPATDIEYGSPVDLPDDRVAAVISEETYKDLHIWNANCGVYEQIDLSWMLFLGPLVEGHTNCYLGLIIPPEAKRNRELVPESFRNESVIDVSRFMIPEV